MAHLYLQCCCDIVEGIAVDVHVHRICNRLKWTNSKSPEETMNQLQEWLPKELWIDINFVIVGFGQTICEAKKPKCESCLIKDSCAFYNGDTNNSYDLNKKSKNKRKAKSLSGKSKFLNNKKKIEETDDEYFSDFDLRKEDKEQNTYKKTKKHNNVNKILSSRKSNTKEKTFIDFDNLESFDDKDYIRDSSFLKLNKNKKNESRISNEKDMLKKPQINKNLIEEKNNKNSSKKNLIESNISEEHLSLDEKSSKNKRKNLPNKRTEITDDEKEDQFNNKQRYKKKK